MAQKKQKKKTQKVQESTHRHRATHRGWEKLTHREDVPGNGGKLIERPNMGAFICRDSVKHMDDDYDPSDNLRIDCSVAFAFIFLAIVLVLLALAIIVATLIFAAALLRFLWRAAVTASTASTAPRGESLV